MLETPDSVRTPICDRELEESPELEKIISPNKTKPVVRVSKHFDNSPITKMSKTSFPSRT